jgi:membrane associated rhomboid family serine protease
VDGERRREPIFKAPWPAMLIVLSIPVLYWFQSRVPDQNALVSSWGLTSRAVLSEHRYVTLATYMLLHGGWPHALINAVAALAFGPAAARLMGAGLRGALGFFSFYLVCGVLAGLGYVGLNPHDEIPLVGASGAISGLFGAAVRMLNREHRLSPLLTPQVFAVTAAWIGINVVFGLSNLTPGTQGMPVAWQAHILGYFAGLLLVGPWAALFGPRTSQRRSEPEATFPDEP